MVFKRRSSFKEYFESESNNSRAVIIQLMVHRWRNCIFDLAGHALNIVYRVSHGWPIKHSFEVLCY